MVLQPQVAVVVVGSPAYQRSELSEFFGCRRVWIVPADDDIVELSRQVWTYRKARRSGTWRAALDLAAGLVEVFFFASAIGSYQWHGLRKDTENQMHPATPSMRLFMAALIVGEIGGFLVLLAGFLHAWWS